MMNIATDISQEDVDTLIKLADKDGSGSID